MPVYPVAPQFATCCPSRGCLCRDRVPRYPSDLSDLSDLSDEWKVLEPQARAVMKELVMAAGRPMAHDLRAMAADFPPWDSVYAFCQRWNARGCRSSWPRDCAEGSASGRAGKRSRPRASSTPRS